jgi:hypothetical protein
MRSRALSMLDVRMDCSTAAKAIVARAYPLHVVDRPTWGTHSKFLALEARVSPALSRA